MKNIKTKLFLFVAIFIATAHITHANDEVKNIAHSGDETENSAHTSDEIENFMKTMGSDFGYMMQSDTIEKIQKALPRFEKSINGLAALNLADKANNKIYHQGIKEMADQFKLLQEAITKQVSMVEVKVILNQLGAIRNKYHAILRK